LERLVDVRRFIFTWIMLVLVLIVLVLLQTRALGNYYLKSGPEPGGNYTEGILGSFTNANPLYASGSVDSSVSRLVFASLLKYNQNNQLVGDLAQSWTVDDHGVIYTVRLKPDLKWQDGEPLTAADVAFTYHVIQNPDAKSPLVSSWRGVGVEAKGPLTVVFTLPNPLSSFPASLTNGIVPEHLLSGIPPTQLRSVSFNTVNPVGAGPFKWEAIEVHGDTPENREQRIALIPNDTYYNGRPKLGRFIVRAFHDQKQLASSFKKQELNAAVGLEGAPDGTKDSSLVHGYNIPLTSEVLVFLKTNHPILGDANVRKALLQATDTNAIIGGLGYPVIPARGPILSSSVGYDKGLAQLNINQTAANQLLDQAGWKMGSNGIRQKDGKPLSFTIFSQSTNEYTYVTGVLQKQWRAVGVNAEVVLQADTELQPTLNNHSYDVLVYGISIGNDPDVFAYWHSSQANRNSNYLNFSEYKSSAADQSLEAGRTRSDPTIRTIKYRPFLEAWRGDAPAIALYQPRFLYLVNGPLFGFEERSMNTGSDRYANVENWMIREAKTIK
jgi:peptide/nickel transport system substrate-binding protein